MILYWQQRLPLGATPDPPSSTIRLKSFARDGDRWLTISTIDKTCDCLDFYFKGRCEHLDALGIHRLRPFTPSTHPTFSQALSGLVKSLRIRRVEDAVYWLVYLERFGEAQHRFRTARRLLIGSAEDGHSVAVMEALAQRFWRISKSSAPITDLVAEAARICKLPNWWHPDSGGPDYIYESLVGRRMWWYRQWDHTAETLQKEIAEFIAAKSRALSVGGVLAFSDVRGTFGSTKQAEFLLRLAESMTHEPAMRLCRVHLSVKSALSGDNNFLCQAAWMMAGAVSPVANQLPPVTTAECLDLLERAQERWKKPQPIPRWCLDGVHSAGDDPRFMGSLPEMWAVCRAFQHYGRVDPSDAWLPEFQCYDGLIIEASDVAEENR